MKNKLTLLILAGALILVTRTGIAGSAGETYIGVQYGVVISEESISKDFNPTALIGRIGSYFHPNFSIEFRMGFGLQDDTQFIPEYGADGGLDATLDLDYIRGIYGTGQIDFTKWFSIYGVLGASNVKATASIPSIPVLEDSNSESSVSYGIGADIGIGSNVALNIEYMRYLDKHNIDFDVIGAGVVFSF